MKIAVCLSGLFRGIQKCIPTWQQFLLSNHEFDFFVCTGPTVEWCSGSSIDFHMNILQNAVKVREIKIVEPVSGPFDKIAHDRNFNKRNLEHVFSMFDKIEQANQLKCEYENRYKFKYDMVMRFRPDTFLKSPIDLNDTSKYHVPKHGDFGGLNDQMCWSSSDNMDWYSGLNSKIIHYLETTDLTLNPELLTKLHWDKSGKLLERPYVLYQLARDNHNMLPDNETRERIMSESGGTRNL